MAWTYAASGGECTQRDSTLPLLCTWASACLHSSIDPHTLPLKPSIPLAGALDLLLDARHALAPKASLQPCRGAASIQFRPLLALGLPLGQADLQTSRRAV